MSDSEAPAAPGRTRVGSDGIWTFIFVDMVVFLFLFLVLVLEWQRLSDLFDRSQQSLNVITGLVSTLMLLTASWLYVEAVEDVRRGRPGRAGRFMLGSWLFGVAFLFNKGFEYSGKLSLGLNPATNGFFTFYYVITGIHFLHVCAGLIFIMHCVLSMKRESATPAYRVKVENVGLFWHFVDLLWFFIYFALYLSRPLS